MILQITGTHELVSAHVLDLHSSLMHQLGRLIIAGRIPKKPWPGSLRIRRLPPGVIDAKRWEVFWDSSAWVGGEPRPGSLPLAEAMNVANIAVVLAMRPT